MAKKSGENVEIVLFQVEKLYFDGRYSELKMIEKYTKILEDLKAGRIKLTDFLYKEGTDEEGHSYDQNSTKRFQLLIALQYNPSLRDEETLVELFKSEIEKHRKAPFQGLYPALKLNAFLISQYSNPKYTKLFLEAKQANFDTHCGFDYQFLVSTGLSQTYNSIEQEKPEIKEAFYYYVGESLKDCYISESELIEWKKYLNEEYPEKLIINGILDEIGLAIDLEEIEILNEKVNEWKSSKSSWTEIELYQLNYYKGIVKDISTQIWANEELLKFKTSDWDCASQLQQLSKLLIQNNQFELAWNKIKDSQKHLKRISDWKTVGLGQFIVENAFDVVLGINNKNEINAKEAFKWASNNIKRMKNLNHNLLEKTIKAGELMGDIYLKDKFSKVLKKEREELDKILNRK